MDQMQAEQIATGQLDSGERLLWAGYPAPISSALGALPMSLFGIPFTAFAAFWMWGALGAMPRSVDAGPWAFFPLFGLPFLLIGIGMLSAPIWAYLAGQKTVFAVTDRRALIIAGFRGRSVQSYTAAEIGEISRIEGRDGRGTVYFASRSNTTSKGYERVTRAGFVGIPDVRRVEQLIREQLKGKAA